MLTPLLDPRGHHLAPRWLRAWWAGLTREERQGVIAAAVTVAIAAAVAILIRAGAGVP